MKREPRHVKKAVCLFSAGLDSTTVLWMARRDGYQPYALTVSYGQRHGREVACARQIASDMGIDHEIISTDLPWKGSALLDASVSVPTGRDLHQIGRGIPVTYVPGRNSIFLALAMSYAEAIGAEAVFIGANAVDYSGYPDCRPEFLAAIGKAFVAGTKAGVEGRAIEIKAPLIAMTKKEIILTGHALGVPFEKTWSCYQGFEMPCGLCDACLLRLKGFREAGLTDPFMSHASLHGC